jgi:hypothetical protein
LTHVNILHRANSSTLAKQAQRRKHLTRATGIAADSREHAEVTPIDARVRTQPRLRRADLLDERC